MLAAEDYFTGYRETVREEDELIVAVRIPVRGWRTAAYKVAKRQSDDISIVAAVFALGLDEASRVVHVRLAYGGVAAMPLRARAVEDFLLGRRLDETTLTQAAGLLGEAFTPLSDHRAGADYRRALCANLFLQFVAEHAS